MGLKRYIKKYKTYEQGVLSRRAIARGELQKIKAAEKKAYFIEAQEQARLRGIRVAKAKFNKRSFSQSFKKAITPITKKPIKSVKRKKRKSAPKRRRVVKYIYN